MTGKPIRIAHVMGHMAGGGVEATVMNYYRHIDHDRIQFDFVVDADSTNVPRSEIELLGGRVFTVPPYKKIPQYFAACKDLFREQKPDIVHSNINTLSVFPLFAAKCAGIPIRIAHSHSTSNPKEYTRTFIKNTLKPFSKIYPTHLAACSEYSARWLFGNETVNAGKVHIIKNAIDLDRFAFCREIRERRRLELGIGNNQLVIGQVGRLSFQKNQLFALDVFCEVLKTRPDALFLVAGEGELRHRMEEVCHLRGLDDKVRLLGNKANIQELYDVFDVLVFPSRYEGLPLTAVESQANGLPIVMSTAISNEACIVPELIARLPFTCSVKQWASALIAHGSRELSLRGQDNTNLIAAGYEIKHSANTLCSWYESLLA